MNQELFCLASVYMTDKGIYTGGGNGSIFIELIMAQNSLVNNVR